MTEVRDVGLGVLEIFPARFSDSRGYFSETWQRDRFRDLGIDVDWMQDNQSFSSECYVLRGLHFQLAPHAQDKLIRVLRGVIFDVAVDIRPESVTFGKWVSTTLSAEALNQFFVPKGFAHGFLTLTPEVEVLYKVSAPYAPSSDRSVAWNDPSIGIDWPLPAGVLPRLSAKDSASPDLHALSDSLTF